MADLHNTKPHKEKKTFVQSLPLCIFPPAVLMKVNVDVASPIQELSVASAATVARDIECIFLGAWAVACLVSRTQKTMEAFACREGMALANDLANKIRNDYVFLRASGRLFVRFWLEQEFRKLGLVHEYC